MLSKYKSAKWCNNEIQYILLLSSLNTSITAASLCHIFNLLKPQPISLKHLNLR